MINVLTPPRAAAHHRIAAPVDREQKITAEFERLLLAVSPADKRTSQLHKDIQQGKNKAPGTVGSLFNAALVNGEHSKLRAFAYFVGALCSKSASNVCRCFHKLYAPETREDGELNNIQVLVAQGDRSPQTLQRLIDELDDSIAIKTEMRVWAINELHIVQTGISR